MDRLIRSLPSTFALTAFWAGMVLLHSLPAQADSRVVFNPPRGGAPQQTRGGASRGEAACLEASLSTEQHLIALTPDSGYGLTLSTHPSFFVYVPPTSANELFFSLKDESGQITYQSRLPIAGNGGIIRIDLPTTAPALAVNQPYSWGVALLSAGKLRPDSPFTSAWVRRGQLAENDRAERSPSLERAAFYGAQGIWYDTLAILADLRRQQPNNAAFASTWQDLLNSVELNQISSAPLVDAS